MLERPILFSVTSALCAALATSVVAGNPSLKKLEMGMSFEDAMDRMAEQDMVQHDVSETSRFIFEGHLTGFATLAYGLAPEGSKGRYGFWQTYSDWDALRNELASDDYTSLRFVRDGSQFVLHAVTVSKILPEPQPERVVAKALEEHAGFSRPSCTDDRKRVTYIVSRSGEVIGDCDLAERLETFTANTEGSGDLTEAMEGIAYVRWHQIMTDESGAGQYWVGLEAPILARDAILAAKEGIDFDVEQPEFELNL